MPQYITIIKDTPIWVWILLVFLVIRGVKALSNREMSIGRIFLLPTVFLVWGIHSVLTETYFSNLSLVMMGIGLIFGTTIGWILWRSQPRLRKKTNSNLIIRPGTPLTLIVIMITFVSKFIMTALLSIYPILLHSLHYNLLFGLLSGLLDGIFWGGTLNLFISWCKNKSS
ncbi:DUF6622 family protein [Xenorhabdus bovienii]|uniref:DUF1453 domain-containing protein n=1 Tax=Xenorhabdus bovienii TaxID=40576 RepID=A0A0B6XD20_XENBV|nr:DUF6622 family protein [Xenorhabdus bovienii]MCG3472347.1 hypothetical protein [Xenorhabdus bovienii]CDM91081.1 conserved membrane protein of unknown function [Xenorhabdus bovienii]